MAATTTPKTGHGATVAFSGSTNSALAPKLVGITMHSETRGDVEISDLSSSCKLFLPEDLIDYGEVTLRIHVVNSEQLPALESAETVTITAKLETGETTARIVAGTGYVKSRGGFNFNTSEARIAEVRVKWDGTTPPALTIAT